MATDLNEKFHDLPNQWAKLLNTNKDQFPDKLRFEVLLALIEKIAHEQMLEDLKKIHANENGERDDIQEYEPILENFSHMCCDLALEAILAMDNQYDRVCDIDVSKLPQWYNNHYMNVINALKHDEYYDWADVLRTPPILQNDPTKGGYVILMNGEFVPWLVRLSPNSDVMINDYQCMAYQNMARAMLGININVIYRAYLDIFIRWMKLHKGYKYFRVIVCDIKLIMRKDEPNPNRYVRKCLFSMDNEVFVIDPEEYFKTHTIRYKVAETGEIKESKGEVKEFSKEIADIMYVKPTYYVHEFDFDNNPDKPYFVYFIDNGGY